MGWRREGQGPSRSIQRVLEKWGKAGGHGVGQVSLGNLRNLVIHSWAKEASGSRSLLLVGGRGRAGIC